MVGKIINNKFEFNSFTRWKVDTVITKKRRTWLIIKFIGQSRVMIPTCKCITPSPLV